MALFQGGELNPEARQAMEGFGQNIANSPLGNLFKKKGGSPWFSGWLDMSGENTYDSAKRMVKESGENEDQGDDTPTPDKKPFIDKENQTMNLPNWMFPKKHEKSILNLPGKIFSKENRQAAQQGLSGLLGRLNLGDMNMGGFKNPFAHGGAGGGTGGPPTRPTTGLTDDNEFDLETYDDIHSDDAKSLISKGQGFIDRGIDEHLVVNAGLDAAKLGATESTASESTNVGFDAGAFAGSSIDGLINDDKNGNNVKYDMSGPEPSSFYDYQNQILRDLEYSGYQPSDTPI